jgi:hypothetical protein
MLLNLVSVVGRTSDVVCAKEHRIDNPHFLLLYSTLAKTWAFVSPHDNPPCYLCPLPCQCVLGSNRNGDGQFWRRWIPQ